LARNTSLLSGARFLHTALGFFTGPGRRVFLAEGISLHTPGSTVLVADADPLIGGTLRHALLRAGYQVLEAREGARALSACLLQKPSLAIIDYSLPGSSGPELVRAIGSCAKVPIVLLSVFSEPAIADEALSMGALAYLVKPVDTQEIVRVVDAILQRSFERSSQSSDGSHPVRTPSSP
jgi:two-component system, response regulator PdtaR